MSAIVPKTGTIRQLDRQSDPDQRVTPEQWTDAPRMSRLMTEVLRNVASLLRRFNPGRLDYEDVSVDGTGTTLYRFPHAFGCRARYWPVEWSGAAAPNLRKHSSSDDNTLVLTSTSAGTVTLRLEEAG